jgi:4-amino-4-deoxy-L-arabinose transferase-like glycosyltransferase
MKKEGEHTFNRMHIAILGFLLLIGLICRLYKYNTPLADFHSWRQADTAAVARNFVKDGFNLLQPRYDDLSSVQTGQENPKGYRFVEFPIYNAIFAALYKIAPIFPLEVWGRLTSIFFSLLVLAVIYYLTLKEYNLVAAIAAALVYGTFPFFVFFSRTVLPDISAVSFAFLAIFFVYRAEEIGNKIEDHKVEAKMAMNRNLWFILAAISFMLGLLIKPTVIFYAIAILFLFFRIYQFSIFKRIIPYIFAVISLAPLVAWRMYISHYPEGIPASGWLITSVNTYQGVKEIFFRPAFFRWIFFERINNIILGGYMTPFLILGSITRLKNYLLYAIGISALLYLFVFQGGNVQHEYYQIIVLPALAIMVGVGVGFIYVNKNILLPSYITYTVVVVCFVFSYLFSYFQVKGYYDYNDGLVQIANIISTLTSPNDKIVTDSQGDTTLLYLSNRKGAPAFYKEPDELKILGYKYLVTFDQSYAKQLIEKNYTYKFKSDKFVLFNL